MPLSSSSRRFTYSRECNLCSVGRIVERLRCRASEKSLLTFSTLHMSVRDYDSHTHAFVFSSIKKIHMQINLSANPKIDRNYSINFSICVNLKSVRWRCCCSTTPRTTISEILIRIVIWPFNNLTISRACNLHIQNNKVYIGMSATGCQ